MPLLTRVAHFTAGSAAAGFGAVGLALLCNLAEARDGCGALAIAVALAAAARRISRDWPPFGWTVHT
jgi:hypothetical protein